MLHQTSQDLSMTELKYIWQVILTGNYVAIIGRAIQLLLYVLQLTSLQITVEGLEKERDFYFGKLRDIEVQCQEEEDAPAGSVIDKIKAILYATEVSAVSLRFF